MITCQPQIPPKPWPPGVPAVPGAPGAGKRRRARRRAPRGRHAEGRTAKEGRGGPWGGHRGEGGGRGAQDGRLSLRALFEGAGALGAGLVCVGRILGGGGGGGVTGAGALPGTGRELTADSGMPQEARLLWKAWSARQAAWSSACKPGQGRRPLLLLTAHGRRRPPPWLGAAWCGRPQSTWSEARDPRWPDGRAATGGLAPRVADTVHPARPAQ